MKIVWFTWKDLDNPLSGGAEVFNEHMATRLTDDGHQVIFLVSGFTGCSSKSTRNGFTIIRFGNRFTVYPLAAIYYLRHLRLWADFVLEEVNTVPFFTKMYTRGKKRALIIHQLCREIWFYQFPWILAWFGYIIEPLYIRLLSGDTVITISESSKRDIEKYGHSKTHIHIIPMANDTSPVKLLAEKPARDRYLLSLGAIRPMKRTLDQVRAFEIIHQEYPQLTFKIVGNFSGSYGRKVRNFIRSSTASSSIQMIGHASTSEKIDLYKQAYVLLSSSLKEGWGLIVTEAASQGTPSVVYDVDGLRDSVIHNNTGLVVEDGNYQAIADAVTSLLRNDAFYERLRKNAYKNAKNMTFDKTYASFLKLIRYVYDQQTTY